MNTMMKRLSGLVLLGIILAGCATGPVYRPAPKPGDDGYRDTQLTSQQFRVSFAGGNGVARETVENFALFRAAEVALAHGANRFRVTSRETSPITENTNYGPTASIGYGYGWGYPFWGTGIGYSTGNSISRTRYQSVLMVQIGSDVPKDGPNVYDAGQIKQNLSAEVAQRQR